MQKCLRFSLCILFSLGIFSCSDTKQETSDSDTTKVDSISGVGGSAGYATSGEDSLANSRLKGGIESGSDSSESNNTNGGINADGTSSNSSGSLGDENGNSSSGSNGAYGNGAGGSENKSNGSAGNYTENGSEAVDNSGNASGSVSGNAKGKNTGKTKNNTGSGGYSSNSGSGQDYDSDAYGTGSGTGTKKANRKKGTSSSAADSQNNPSDYNTDKSGTGSSLSHLQKQANSRTNRLFNSKKNKSKSGSGSGSGLGQNSYTSAGKKASAKPSKTGKAASEGKGYVDGSDVASGDPQAGKPLDKPVEAAAAPKDAAAGQSVETLNAVAVGRKYFIYPFAISAKTNVPVDAKIELVEESRPKFRYPLQSYVYNALTFQEKESPDKIVVCKTFGYKPADVDLDLRQIFSDSTKDFIAISKDTVFVRFALDRLRKRDIAVMYNVYFYHDAAVMQPKSIPELESLISMLNENTKMKVRIHGHTNGGSYGKMVSLAEGDTMFFKLGSNNKTSTSSAVALSRERADIIKRYLVYKGIAADRLQVKGWGGKRMLYEKSSMNANKNKRVEIEIIQD